MPQINVALRQETHAALESMKGGEGRDSFDAVIRDLLEAATGNGVADLEEKRLKRMNANAVDRVTSSPSEGSGYVENVGMGDTYNGDSGK